MQRPSITQLLPNAIELGYVAIAACFIVILGNGKLILERTGFIGSTNLISQQVTTQATNGLLRLDSFRFTANIMSLVIWGIIGLVIYSVLQAIVRTMRLVAYERDFDTPQYIHPRGFTHKAYWRAVATDTVFGFVLLALLVAIGAAYFIIALPTSSAYVRRFILHPGISTIGDPLLSLIVAFVATTVLYFALKLVIRHHQVAIAEV